MDLSSADIQTLVDQSKVFVSRLSISVRKIG